jgi:hypothetical protein
MLKLKEQVRELIYNEKYVISWQHIRSRHPNITESDIINGLIYGLYKPDREIDGRYLSWSKMNYPPRLIRIVFEVDEIDAGSVVRVITAFDED